MVSIQEKISSYFEVEKSGIDISYISEFAQAFRGEISYDSTNESIEIWEDFILTWLNGGVYEEKEEFMKLLFATFQPDYVYEGELYRGMMKPENEGLYPMPLASYSSYDEVAFYFAGKSHTYGIEDNSGPAFESVIITVQAESAFSFDDFLKKLDTLTTNKELRNEIEVRIWENEKIFPLPAYVLDGYLEELFEE
jgi:hypothetical protein